MPKVTVVPLTSFAHGSIDAHEGRPIALDVGVADDLEKAGLVRVKRPPVQGIVQTPPASAPAKAQDDGAGQPSSASQVAPVSPMTTSAPSAPGARNTRSVKPGA